MPDAGESLREPIPNDPDSTDTLRTEDLARRRALIDSREGRVGPYRLLETIGEGGFGTVYLAEQVEPIRRRVALKIIKAGMDTKQVIARFEAERQALAMMNHPNVAKVFDAGATDRGRPYFVMEHVPGVRITEHCDRHRSDIKERLDLFLQVCEAIQHAHQKGIIHRDIKPSNILVSVKEGKPLPKVIDFGVAKATAGRLTDKTVYTEQGQWIGTPAYMSPEQAEMTAQDIDTRSDIYSLGVLLYELLTGTVPFDPTTLQQCAHSELQRIIREVEPPKPSTRISTLSSEPQRGLVAGPGASGARATGPPPPLQRGDKGGSPSEPRPLGSGDVPARERRLPLPHGRGSVDDIAHQRRADPASLRKQLRGDLDWITMKAMEKDRTRRYASASDFAADIGRYLHDEPVLARPPSTAYRLKKFVRRNRSLVFGAVAVFAALILGIVATGMALSREAQQRRLAEEQRTRAVEAEKVATTQAQTAKRVSEFLVGIFKVSDPSEARGNTITAREILDRGAEKITRELTDQPMVRATLLDTIGNVYSNLGLYDSAKQLLESALTIRRQELGDMHLDVAKSLDRLAEVLGQQYTNIAEAESLQREALVIYRKLLGDENPDVALRLARLGQLLAHQGRLAEAEPLVREALDMNHKLRGEGQPSVVWSLYAMVEVLRQQGKLSEAEPLLREALAINRKAFGDKHSSVATSLHELGCILQDQGKLTEAEELFREGLERCLAAWGNEFWLCGNTRSRLGYCLREMGRFADAEGELLEAHRVLTASLGPQHGRTVGAVQRLIALYEAWDAAEPGKGHAEKAAEWREKLEETPKN